MTSESLICPHCGRLMSYREHDEQGACNRCYTGRPVALADVLDRLPDDARVQLAAKRPGGLT